MCYDIVMDTYFEFKHSIQGADVCYSRVPVCMKNTQVCYSRKPVIDEREIHPYHEILYYLDGDATLICEGFSHPLRPGALILIPRGQYHFFMLDTPSRFERLKISFYGVAGFERLTAAEMREIRIFDEPTEEIKEILDRLCLEMSEGETGERRDALLLGSLLMLLSLLDRGKQMERNVQERSHLITDVIRYVDVSLTKALDTPTVAKAMNVSPSTLSHVFKREMGISLHKYVTEKRMIYAKHLIDEGKAPTKVFAECGYGDYSSFYKAYVKIFGAPPSGNGST